MKHQTKIGIGLILAATIILGIGAANEIFYQSRTTTKLVSSILQFDANSKIQDDGATKTWDFAATAGANTVLRGVDMATPIVTGAASFRTNVYIASATFTNASAFQTNVTIGGTATITNAVTLQSTLAVAGAANIGGALGVTNITSTALVISGTASASGFLAGSSPGIAATVDVLVPDSTTNRLVFIGGILVSNITTFAQ